MDFHENSSRESRKGRSELYSILSHRIYPTYYHCLVRMNFYERQTYEIHLCPVDKIKQTKTSTPSQKSVSERAQSEQHLLSKVTVHAVLLNQKILSQKQSKPALQFVFLSFLEFFWFYSTISQPSSSNLHHSNSRAVQETVQVVIFSL